MSVVSIAEAWPLPGKPFTVAEHYEETARVSGDEVFAARRPFGVEVAPARLVTGLQPPSA